MTADDQVVINPPDSLADGGHGEDCSATQDGQPTTEELVSAATVAHPESVRGAGGLLLRAPLLDADTALAAARTVPGAVEDFGACRCRRTRRMVEGISGPDAGRAGSPRHHRQPEHQGGLCATATGTRRDSCATVVPVSNIDGRTQRRRAAAPRSTHRPTTRPSRPPATISCWRPTSRTKSMSGDESATR